MNKNILFYSVGRQLSTCTNYRQYPALLSTGIVYGNGLEMESGTRYDEALFYGWLEEHFFV